MNFDAQTIVSLIAAVGLGGIINALIAYFKDRRKIDSEVNKTDVDTQLAYLKTVIEQLREEISRIINDRGRVQLELIAEQDRSANLRKRVRELEDEIDGVRRAARDTQQKCDELANRLQQLVDDAQEN